MVKLQQQDLLERIVKKKEDDPKRDKRKCIYFDDNFCENQMIVCYGSSHCKYYREDFIVKSIENSNLKSDLQKEDDEYFKEVMNTFVYKKSKKTIIIEPKVEKKKTGHIIIETTNEKYEQLYAKSLNEELFYIRLCLAKAYNFNDYNKYKFIAFFIQTEDNLFQCGTRESNVIMVKYDDVIRIQIPVLRFHLKEVPVYNGKFLWKQRDSNFGTIIFKSNKSK